MGKIKESSIESILKLENIYVESFDFIRGKYVDENPSIEFDKNIEFNEYSSEIVLKCKVEWNEETKLNVSLKASFSISNSNGDKNSDRILLTRNSCAIMFPYLRSQITLLTSQLNFTPIVFPAINVNVLFDE